MKWTIALALGGCILPVSTGAPLPPTTVGAGHAGFAASGEAPVLDLIANNKDPNNTDYTNTYGASPAAAATFTLSYGIGPDTDLEVAGEGALYYFVVPIPTGGSVGLRQHLMASEVLDLGVAARLGGVSSGATSTDSSGNSKNNEASAVYAAAQVIAQVHSGTVRPLAALNLMPFRITRAITGDPIERFKGFASSFTFGVMFVGRHAELGPYVTVTDFESDRFSGARFVSGGLVLAIRNDRSYAPPPPQIMTPAPPPPPYYTPPPQ